MDNRIAGATPLSANAGSAAMRNNTDSASNTQVSSVPAENNLVKSSTDQEINMQQLEKAIRAVQGPEKTLQFSIHKETHAIMVKVFDKQTGDLLREIPPEKLLDAAANMMELNGLIFDEKA